MCERWAGDRDRLLYWPHSISFSSWLGCSIVGHWKPKALCLLLALNSASCPQLTQAVCALVILLFNTHQLPLFFYLFTQVHLLIDGSVEGQSITYRSITFRLSLIPFSVNTFSLISDSNNLRLSKEILWMKTRPCFMMEWIIQLQNSESQGRYFDDWMIMLRISANKMFSFKKCWKVLHEPNVLKTYFNLREKLPFICLQYVEYLSK